MTGPPRKQTPVPICGSVTGATNQEALDDDHDYSRHSEPAQVCALDFWLANACGSFHALGPRALYEFVHELEGQSPDLGRFMRERMSAYNRMNFAQIETLTNSGGFPPPPIYRVPEG